MSYKVTSLVRSRKAGSPTKKVILMVMADVANHDGSGVWISTKTIASESEVSTRTIKRQLKQFEQEGILIRDGYKPCMGGHTVNYKMNLQAISALEKSGDILSEVVTEGAGVVTEGAQKDALSVTQTVLEQSLLNKDTNVSKDFVPIVFEAWNDMAEKNGLNTVRMTPPTHNRWRFVLKRLDDCAGFQDDLLLAISNIPNNRHWLGHNDRCWKPDFDWFFKSQDNFTKALEYTQADEIKNAKSDNSDAKDKISVNRDRRRSVRGKVLDEYENEGLAS